jgi:glutathione peroxidase
MKTFTTVVFLSAVFTACGFSQKNQQKNTSTQEKVTGMKTLHDFKATTIDGEIFDMAQLKGKKVMIVNVASKCGYTPQYKQLQELYENYKDKGFVILGFPCNQFMGQEPGTEEEIKTFCEKNYGVTFPLFSKIDVKGKDQHPIYQWLTQKALNGVEDSEVSWNFNKYLIDENGKYVMHLKSGADPFDDKIINWLEGK